MLAILYHIFKTNKNKRIGFDLEHKFLFFYDYCIIGDASDPILSHLTPAQMEVITVCRTHDNKWQERDRVLATMIYYSRFRQKSKS